MFVVFVYFPYKQLGDFDNANFPFINIGILTVATTLFLNRDVDMAKSLIIPRGNSLHTLSACRRCMMGVPFSNSLLNTVHSSPILINCDESEPFGVV
jgi:hypothetical protein